MSCTTVTRPGAPAHEALVSTIAGLQRADALAPVTVAVPSAYAGLSLRRCLAARHGLVNVHFVVLERVAELLGAATLGAERRPLTPAVAAEATRLALHEIDVPGLQPTRRTVAAVTATLREARRAGITPSGPLAAVAAARRRPLRDHYDEEDELEAAAAAVGRAAPGLADVGTVVWYLPMRLTPGTTAFARALADVGRLRVVAAATGDPAADGIVDEVTHVLGDPVERPGTERPPTATHLLVAPDRDTEVRAVAGDILAAAERGIPFHRIGVTFTNGDPYLRLLHERLGAGGIPVAGPASRRLAETAAGRAAVGLLRVLELEFARDVVLDLLTTVPLRDDVGDPRRLARWDLASRRAGIVGGLDAWEARLATSSWHAAGTEDAGDAAALLDVLRTLVPPGAGWKERARHVVSVLDHLLGDASHLPADEVDAHREVRRIAGALADLDALGGGGDDGAFADALRAELDAPTGAVGTTGTGVLVAPPRSLAGSELDVVHVLGLGEGSVTGAAVDDPLLAGHGLARRQRDRERGAYLAALACAPRRVVSFPRADLRAERAVMPGAWALESAATLAGRPVTAAELLAERSDEPWLTTVASLEDLVATDPPGPDEARLTALLGWRSEGRPLDALPDAEPELRRGFAAIGARHGPRASAWDGVVGPLAGLVVDDAHPLSATRLEVYASCPFRYFLRSVLHVEEVERPETLDRLDPRRRGTLVHDALRELLADHIARAPDEGWSANERDQLAAIMERRLDALAGSGPGGRPTLWTIERRRLLAAARAFLDADERIRACGGVSPWLLEVGFGDGEDDALDPLDLDLGHDPVAHDTPGADHHGGLGRRRVRFRGRIDRVDRTPDGSRVEVFDYKTGTPSSGALAGDPVAAGALLQPVLYGLVARREVPDATVGSHYWYTGADPGQALDGLDTVDHRAVERLRTVLGEITGGVTAGLFPRDPGRDEYFGPAHCRTCDHARACPQDRVRTAELRMPDDPAYGPLRRLRAAP